MEFEENKEKFEGKITRNLKENRRELLTVVKKKFAQNFRVVCTVINFP
jgi:hypothetical protein